MKAKVMGSQVVLQLLAMNARPRLARIGMPLMIICRIIAKRGGPRKWVLLPASGHSGRLGACGCANEGPGSPNASRLCAQVPTGFADEMGKPRVPHARV